MMFKLGRVSVTAYSRGMQIKVSDTVTSISTSGVWVRTFPNYPYPEPGPGYSLTWGRPLFSERFGHTIPIAQYGRFRLFRVS